MQPAQHEPRRAEFYRRIGAYSMTPLWEVLHSLVPTEPAAACVPAHWRYRDVRPFLLESGEIISAREAVRRVLVLENPACPGESRVTNTLYAGLQLILPGEVAPSHRHTQSAMRFVLEGEGAYTAVDGERASMHPGDLVLTPNWTWHDHGSDADGPVVWLDCLDIPLVRFLAAGFAEAGDVDVQPSARPEGDSLARYGANLLPVDHRPRGRTSPVFCYPYARTREALERLSRTGPVDPHHGIRMRYVNPVTGGDAVPTISSFVQWLPAGFRGRTYRSTDGCVFVPVAGRGTLIAGGRTFAFEPRDVLVVPGWTPYRVDCDEDAVLFGYSDRVVHEKLDLWRERRE